MSYRAIHSSVNESESLAAVSDFAERLFWRILARSDSWGRMRGETAKVRANCVPLLRVTDPKIEKALGELETVGRLDRYDHEGMQVIQVVDFDKSQPPEFLRRRSASKLPERSVPTPGVVREQSGSDGETELWSALRERSGSTPGLKTETETEIEEKQASAVRDIGDPVVRLLAVLVDADKNTERTVRTLVSRHRLSEGDLEFARECALGPNVKSRSSVAVSMLKQRAGVAA